MAALMMTKKIILSFLAVFFLSSCSLIRPKIPPYPSGVFFPLEEGGELTFAGEVIDRVENLDGNLYFSTQNGFVYAIDGRKREILWGLKVAEVLASSLFSGSKNIYVYDQDSVLYSLDKKGSLVWKKKVEERITSGVAEFNNKIYFGTEKGILFVYDASSGEEVWRFQAENAIWSTPVFSAGEVIFGCDDHCVYILDEKGSLLDKLEVGDKVRAAPLVEKNRVYFGADDHRFYCFNLKKGKLKWRIKTGGKSVVPPVIAGRRIFFLSWNNVLFCLNKKNGHIIWWDIIPSRSVYRLEISGTRIVVSSLSSVLVCFDTESGEKVGDFNAGQEVKSNPVWLQPYLVYSLYDELQDKGKLVFLKKVMNVSLKSSVESPQQVGKEISFTVSATGFYKPKYEFTLKEGEEKKVVQAKSEKNSWLWFPEKEGNFVVGVEVVDEKQSKKAEISFVIE